MKVLFAYQKLASFVEKDLRILQEVHVVRECHFRGIRDLPGLFQGVWWSDVTFSWFGKLHAFFSVLFSKLLGKKSVVVAGGDDVAKVPEIGYGLFASRWKKWCALFVFKYADLILCVSESNRAETLSNARADPRKVKMLYHGFNVRTFRLMSEVQKEDIVLTVGRVTAETIYIKGLKLFVQSAHYLPDREFVLIGPWGDGTIDKLKKIAPKNVTFAGGVYGDELIRMYSKAKVYVQTSMHESFGCSVAEAMLCECVPVVSRYGALPEVVGDCGLYVDNLEPEEVAMRIEQALHSGLGVRARERIMRLFPLDKRRDELLAVLKELNSVK
jgi:glycosyltransferase involved in cell wall biosynthesis